MGSSTRLFISAHGRPPYRHTPLTRPPGLTGRLFMFSTLTGFRLLPISILRGQKEIAIQFTKDLKMLQPGLIAQFTK